MKAEAVFYFIMMVVLWGLKTVMGVEVGYDREGESHSQIQQQQQQGSSGAASR